MDFIRAILAALSQSNSTAFETNTTNVSGQNPCNAQELPGNVTVVRVLLRPNLNGATSLQFTMRYLIPESGDGTQYSLSNICQGVARGAACLVLRNPMTITFETTALYATYDLTNTGVDVPYAFLVTTRNRFASKAQSIPSNPTPTGENCNNLQTDTTVTPGNGYTNAGLTSYCPAAVLNGNEFYTPPTFQFLGSDSSCPGIICPANSSVAFGSFFQRLSPPCSVYDIQAQPRALLNIRVNVTIGDRKESIVLSTKQSNSVGAIPGVLYAQVITAFFGSGIVANNVEGLIVTCNLCDANADLGCQNGLVDDMPAVGADGFNLYKPWKPTTSCTLPVPYCRQKGMSPPGTPSKGFWYYVHAGRKLNYLPNICNSNAFGGYYNLFAADTGSLGQVYRMCQNLASYPGTCVAGYAQPPTSSAVREQIIFTPCLVQQHHVERVNGYYHNEYANRVDYIPFDYNTGAPQYWIHDGKLFRTAYETNSAQAGVEMALYLSQSFLQEVVYLAPGTFVQDSVHCAGAQYTSGSVTFGVANLNNTVSASYRVTATFVISTAAVGAQLVVTGASSTSTTKNTVTAYTLVEVGPGAVTYSSFEYQYSGDIGYTSLYVTLVLSATTASFEDIVFATAANISCVTLAGAGNLDSLFSVDSQNVVLLQESGGPCFFFLFCSTDSWFMIMLKIIGLVIVFAIIITFLVYLAMYATTSYKYNQRALRGKQNLQQRREMYEAKENRANLLVQNSQNKTVQTSASE